MKNEKEAAVILGCSVAALRKWRLHGKGPRYHLSYAQNLSVL